MIGEALRAIQCELKAPKGQYNSFGKYKYRSCEDILEALKPLLMEHGVTLTLTDEIVLVGNRYYVKATATLNGSGEGEHVQVTAYAREPEDKKGADQSQVTGASSSYARKYALNGLFLIDDTKDADATNTHGKEPRRQEPEPEPSITQDQWQQLSWSFNDCAAAIGATTQEERNALWADAQRAVGAGFTPQMGARAWSAAVAWLMDRMA